ncbi:MAG TPA: ABC transporter permease, partial [Nitrospiraceae bacterium]|nr:ABC transporter permease [Nitrospiraceae bacterium]
MIAPSFTLRETALGAVLIVQEFTLLCVQAIMGIAGSRRYASEIIVQIERVGVGSLFIVILTGLFTGMVLTLQGAIQLEPYGATIYVSRLVSTSVVREL